MNYKLFFILFLFDFNVCIALAVKNTFTLELLQVLFRHGDRVPDKSDIYLTDPYAGTFKDLGYSNLLNIGKEREFKIGQVLRERYNNFLGDYKNAEVYAYTTDKDRTKQSLDLVLAGLYPPTCKTKWSDTIFWSPIPTHYNLTKNDILRSFVDCDIIQEMFTNAMNSVEIQTEFRKNQKFLDYVESSTGNRTDLFTIFQIHNSLASAKSLKLPLPDWCSEDDYNKINEISGLVYDAMVLTPLQAKITAGQFIQKMLSNIKEHESKGDMKIYLYSAHNSNVGSFSKVHNFTNIPILPDYGSTYIIEKLRGSDNQIYIRMFMWTGVSEEWIPVKVQDCDYECLLADYVEIMKWVIPNEEEARLCSTLEPCCAS